MKPFFLCMAVFLLSSPVVSFGHGVETSEVTGETGRPAHSVRFRYSTGEPMMYAAVRAYAPSQPDMEALRGSTDRNGLFAFVPDEDGQWRIMAEDGMGHGGTIAVNAATKTGTGVSAGEVSAGTPTRPLAIVLGLSLILNVFATWNFFGARRKGGADAH